MINEYKKYSKIIICGPQRSGTTFACRALASQLGYEALYEELFNTYDEELFLDLVRSKDKFVLQAPGMTHLVHTINSFEESLILLMRRNLKDIVASQNRISWNKSKKIAQGVTISEEMIEKVKYASTFSSALHNIPLDKGIAEIKYYVWDTIQKSLIAHSSELNYSELKRMFPKLWVAKNQRTNFHPRQTDTVLKNDPVLTTYFKSKTSKFGQLFFDYGEGFSEKDSTYIIYDDLSFNFSYSIDGTSKLQNLRFDPLNDYSLVHDLRISLFDKNGEIVKQKLEFRHNGMNLNEDSLLFFTTDPNIYFSVTDFKRISRFAISGRLENEKSTIKIVIEKLLEKVSELSIDKDDINPDSNQRRNYPMELQILRARFKNLKIDFDKISESEELLRSKNLDLETRLNKLKENLDRSLNEFSETQRRIETLTGQRDKGKAESEKMTKEVKTLLKRVDYFKDKNKKKENELKVGKKELKRMTTRLNDIQEKVIALEANVSESEKKGVALQRKYDKSQSRLSKVRSELSKVKTIAEQQLVDSKLEIGQLFGQIQDLNNEIDRHKECIQKDLIESRKKTKRIKHLEEQVAEYKIVELQIKELIQNTKK